MLFIKDNKKILIVGAILLLIFLHYLGALNLLKKTLHKIFIPVSNYVYLSKQFINNKYFSLTQQNELEKLYNSCRAENQDFQYTKAQIQLLANENKKLKDIINFNTSTNYNLISADVVGKSSDPTQKTIIISAGREVGVAINQPVIAGSGILVGLISKVEDRLAYVRLINDNNSKIAATLLNKDYSLGVVEGGYGLSLRMSLIPRNEKVLIGDQVVTSGLTPNIPAGLLIGDVAVSENEAYQPFQQAILNPSIDLSKITFVSVLITN